MSTSNELKLIGTGAAYIRVSGDKQEVQRQVESVAAFEQRHKVKIPAHHRYEDHMPRDMSAKRPDFQRMLKAANDRLLGWIVVDQIDRFGFADEWELVDLIRDLRKAGCKLYDTKGDEWTAGGLMSFFKAGLAGHSSRDEQVKKSSRVLGGSVAKVKASGEWMGAPPQLGFDVACFDRATDKELWRVVWEGRVEDGTEKRNGKVRPKYKTLRRKVHPDGTEERFDGEVVFRTSKETQLVRITPTKDETKLAAVKTLFRRYATEAVSFYDLAKWLKKLGIRNTADNRIQGAHIQRLLGDESYLGYPTYNKRARGRFHRYGAEGGVVELAPDDAGAEQTNAPKDVVRCSVRLFEPLIDRETWDKVQTKLSGRPKAKRVPRVSKMYLTGLIVCAGCGKPMNTRGERSEYVCSTWNKHRLEGNIAASPCQTNAVKQSVIEEYVRRFLDETGRRLEAFTGGAQPDGLTNRLDEQQFLAWDGFCQGIERLESYLAKHHPEQYTAIRLQATIPQEEGGPGHDEFVSDVLRCYRANFDPSGVASEIARLDTEHTKLTHKYADLPTPRAKEKAKAELVALEKQIEELEQQRDDLAGVVEYQYRQMLDLQLAIAEVRNSLDAPGGEEDLRRRAEAIRGVLCRIECEFVLTARPTKGQGNWSRSKLVGLEFVPIAGEGYAVPVDGSGCPVPGATVPTVSYGTPSGRYRPPGRCHPRGA